MTTAHHVGPSSNTGKMMTRRIQAHGRSTVILTYSTLDATALRKLVCSMRLMSDKKPSLSLIARRSLGLYLERLNSGTDVYAAEVAELESMVTPVPKPAPFSKKPVQ